MAILKNVDLRELACRKNIRLWEIGEKLGMSDANFSRKLRNELPKEEKEKIKKIINEIASEQEK